MDKEYSIYANMALEKKEKDELDDSTLLRIMDYIYHLGFREGQKYGIKAEESQC